MFRIVLTFILYLSIGLSVANWNKIPYSVNYNKKPYKYKITTTSTTTAAPTTTTVVPVPVVPVAGVAPQGPSGSSKSTPSKLLSRSGYIGGGADHKDAYMVKRGRYRPSLPSYQTRNGFGRWSLGNLLGGGGGGGGNNYNIDGGGGASGIFMLGGGSKNRRRQVEPAEHISVHYNDHGSHGYGGWQPQPPPAPPKKIHSSQFLATPQPIQEKPGFVQKLIPMFPIKGKFSELITWFSDPHGHRHGFNQHHDNNHGHDHGHGGGWRG